MLLQDARSHWVSVASHFPAARGRGGWRTGPPPWRAELLPARGSHCAGGSRTRCHQPHPAQISGFVPLQELQQGTLSSGAPMQPRLCVECLVSSAKLGWLLTSKHRILTRAQDFLPANEAFCNGIITSGGESSGLKQKEQELLCPRTARRSPIPERTRVPVPQKVPNPSSQVPAAASGPSLLTIGIRASVCHVLPADLVPGLLLCWSPLSFSCWRCAGCP